jgi:hypothetical protein
MSLATVCVHEEGQSGQTYGEIGGIFALRFNKAAGTETYLYKLKKKRHSYLVLCCMLDEMKNCTSTRISGPR